MTQNALQLEAYITVTELTRLLNSALENQFPLISFSGEISQYTKAASGHIYFTVKDAESQISAVMWKGMAQNLDFKPEQGMAVLCHGKPNLYNKSGRLQIVVNRMLPAGEGLLQQKFLKLKAKLEAEGFFSVERKRILPFFPKTIGVVTSGTSAALQDILVKIKERMPATKIVLADVRVQGEGSAEQISAGIDLLNERSDVDLMIVGRGGGSLEDLWAFNEEVVVKAVFRSKIPIICAVGHEVDICLAELTADARAPTPTAAAELAVPHREELARRILELSKRLADTDRWFQNFVQEFDDLSARFEDAVEGVLDQARSNLDKMDSLLKLLEPKRLVERLKSKVDLSAERLKNIALRSFAERKARLDRLGSTLESISPQKVLARGFSVIRSKNKLVTSTKQLKVDDLLEIQLLDGKLDSKVETILE
ncbi:MAG: exodeoxyribonuclease VII large subunit [Bdellovibrionota bacterium]